MTTNGAGGDWVVYHPVTLSDAEKQCLEAIRRLRSFTVAASSDYPGEIDSLEEREFLSRERQGETRVRGVCQGDGFDVYRITEAGDQWLKDCRPVEPVDAAADHPQS